MQLHLIHVGKCAGESVQTALNQHKLYPKEHHCGTSNNDLAELILSGDPSCFFIVLVRDPVKRFVSAFEWDLWEKVLSRDAPPKFELWGQIYETFQTANDLAEALTSKDTATRVMADRAIRAGRLHMQMDLGWYLPPHVARKLTPENASAVRVENIVDDFNALVEKLGGTRPPDFAFPFSKNDYKSNLPSDRTSPLSALAISNVKDYSIASYETIRILAEGGIMPSRV